MRFRIRDDADMVVDYVKRLRAAGRGQDEEAERIAGERGYANAAEMEAGENQREREMASFHDVAAAGREADGARADLLADAQARLNDPNASEFEKQAARTVLRFRQRDGRDGVTAQGTEGEGVRFRIRTKEPPKKTRKVYKLMRLGEDGKLYPLFIDSASPIELGTWYDADSPNLDFLKTLTAGVHLVNAEAGESMTLEQFSSEHPELKIRGSNPNAAAIDWATANGMRWMKVLSKDRGQRRYGGELRSYYNYGINGSGAVETYALRPGWHAGSLPTMRQIGKGPNKNLRDNRFVWVEGEVAADVDYQGEADANPDKDIPDRIPEDGYYLKATNADKAKSQADRVGWFVSGAFKANRIISDAEARRVIDQWNAEHPDQKVEYDYERESGVEFSEADAARVNGETAEGGGVRFRLGDSSETFKDRQKRAVRENGVVMPGLNDAYVNVVGIPRHPYSGSIKEATLQAIKAARELYAPNGNPRLLHYENFGAEFDYTISGNAVSILLSVQHQRESSNKGAHLAIATHLDKVIADSIEVEEHPDRIKTDGIRDNDNINPNALMHRFYGVARINGEYYRVMTLMREDVRLNEGNGVHSYEVTEIKVLDEKTPNTSNGVGTPNSELEAYPLANLIKDVGKTMEPNKLLLDESAKTTESGGISFRVRDEERRDSDESQKLFSAAKAKFGVTNDIREAGYILPDGSMLDFSGRNMLDPGTDSSFLKGRRTSDHRDIGQIGWAYDENGNEYETGLTTDMADFISRGAIRIDNNAGSINLSMAPTREQEAVLRRLIANNDGNVWVDFGDGNNTDHYAEYSDAKATRVLGDIDRYFGEGIKPEGNLLFRLRGEHETGDRVRVRREGMNDGRVRVDGLPGEWRNIDEAGRAMQLSDPEHMYVPSDDGKWLDVYDWRDNEVWNIWRGKPGSKRFEKWRERTLNHIRKQVPEYAKKLGLDVELIEDEAAVPAGHESEKSWYDAETGKIHIVVPRHAAFDVSDVMSSLWHEGVSRHGLRKLVGDDNYDTFLDNVYATSDANIRAEIDRLTEEVTDGDRRGATEEYLSRLAEQMGFQYYKDGSVPVRSWMQRGLKVMRENFDKLCRHLGMADMTETLRDDDLRAVLYDSYHHLLAENRDAYAAAKRAEREDKEYVKAVKRGDIDTAMTMLHRKLAASEGIVGYAAAPGHGGNHREVSHRLKDSESGAIEQAARDMAQYVPKDAVLVPMPPHEGVVRTDTDTWLLAQELSRLTGAPVVAALRGRERESRYAAKQAGRKGPSADELGFYQDMELPAGKTPVFVDNVVGSGETAKAAVQAMGGRGMTLAYTKGNLGKPTEGLKNVTVTYDDAGNLIPLSERFDRSNSDVRFRVRGDASGGTADHTTALEDARRRLESDDASEFERTAARAVIKAYGGSDDTPDGGGPRFRIREPQKAIEDYERAVNSSGFQVTEALQDSMMGLKKLMQAIVGKDAKGKEKAIQDIAGFENAYLKENRLQSESVAQVDEYRTKYYSPLVKAVSALIGKGGKSHRREAMRELTDYMMAKHGLERNEVLAERDATEEFESDANKDGNGNYIRNYADILAEKREKDYSGLTALTGEDDVSAAEDAARQMVDAYEMSHDTTELWQRTKEATDATLDKLHDSGVLSDEVYDRAKTMFEYYIPLRGWDETTSDEVYGYLTGPDGPLNGNVFKHAEGRRSKADDPLATIMMMASDAIRQGNRNVMKQRFLTFVLNNPSDAVSVNRLWLQRDPVTDKWKPVFADLDPADSPEVVRQKVEQFEQDMAQLAAQDPDNFKHGKQAANIPYKVVNGNIGEHRVLVKHNGQTYVLTINGNPRAAQALNGLTNPDTRANNFVGKTLGAFAKLNRVLSQLFTTYSPKFVVRNFARDMGYSIASSAFVKEGGEYGRKFVANYTKVGLMGKLFTKWEDGTLDRSKPLEDMFYQFMHNGGETGFSAPKELKDYKKALDKELRKENSKTRQLLGSFGEFYLRANRAVENRARFAAFVTSMEMGRGVDRSIWDAKEVSVNFNKKGAGAKMFDNPDQTLAGKTAGLIGDGGRSLFVFWNASVQGLTNYGKTYKAHPVKATAHASLLAGLAYMMPQLMQAIFGDDDGYYDLPDYVRRNNICFRWSKDMPWITIPLSPEHAVSYAIGDIIAGIASGKKQYLNGEEIANDFAKEVSKALPLDFTEGGGGHWWLPSAIKPAYEAYEMNESWTGAPIANQAEWNEHAPEYQRVYKTASQPFVKASEWVNDMTNSDEDSKGLINFNPSKLEYVFKGYAGGLATLFNDCVRMFDVAFGDAEFEAHDIPVAGALLKSGNPTTKQKEMMRQYYHYRDDADGAKWELKNREGDALERFKQTDRYERYLVWTEMSKDVDKLKKQMKDNPDLEAEYYAAVEKLVSAMREQHAGKRKPSQETIAEVKESERKDSIEALTDKQVHDAMVPLSDNAPQDSVDVKREGIKRAYKSEGMSYDTPSDREKNAQAYERRATMTDIAEDAALKGRRDALKKSVGDEFEKMGAEYKKGSGGWGWYIPDAAKSRADEIHAYKQAHEAELDEYGTLLKWFGSSKGSSGHIKKGFTDGKHDAGEVMKEYRAARKRVLAKTKQR